MYQQTLDLRDRFSEQLCLNLDVPLDVPENMSNKQVLPSGLNTCNINDGTYNIGSYITVSNCDGYEAARIDNTGLSIKVENKTWLKTKVANWIGVKYL